MPQAIESREVVSDMGLLLIVRFKNQDGNLEDRSFDFRTHDGRHAFLRFTTWALKQKIIFSGADYQTAQIPADSQQS